MSKIDSADLEYLNSEYRDFMDLFESIKRTIRKADPVRYARWKAGGFLIDEDIISNYPTMGKIIEELEPEATDEEA